MAVKPKEAAAASKEAAKPAKEAPAPQGPSALDKLTPYLGPGFVVSMVLVFVGERLLGTVDGARMALSGLGVAGAVGTTALRFSMAGRHKDKERSASSARSECLQSWA